MHGLSWKHRSIMRAVSKHAFLGLSGAAMPLTGSVCPGTRAQRRLPSDTEAQCVAICNSHRLNKFRENNCSNNGLSDRRAQRSSPRDTVCTLAVAAPGTRSDRKLDRGQGSTARVCAPPRRGTVATAARVCAGQKCAQQLRVSCTVCRGIRDGCGVLEAGCGGGARGGACHSRQVPA